MFQIKGTISGRLPYIPKIIVMEKNPGHLGGCGISQNAYWKPEPSLLSLKQRNQKQQEGYVRPSRFVF